MALAWPELRDPVCPYCAEPVTLRRWVRTSGRGGVLETRCNGCGNKIRAYVPWYLQLFMLLASSPLLLIPTSMMGTVHGGFNNFLAFIVFIVAVLAWVGVALVLSYRWFGRVVADD